MKCRRCKKSITSVYDRTTVTIHRQADGSEAACDPTVASTSGVTGALVAAYHHKCWMVENKRSERYGDAVKVTASAHDDLMLNADDLRELGLTVADVQGLSVHQLREKIDGLRSQ